ncbi:hypothetical protein RJ640_001041, partial [Escallonia rubra]
GQFLGVYSCVTCIDTHIWCVCVTDEVSAIVLDLGSHTCKAGYAGEDAPKAVFPSVRTLTFLCYVYVKVVGSLDQMEVDEPDEPEKNSGAVLDTKSKGKRKLYVGSQALGFRRDHMEVLSAMKDGVVVDWDIAESIWDHAFRVLAVDTSVSSASVLKKDRPRFRDLGIKRITRSEQIQNALTHCENLTCLANFTIENLLKTKAGAFLETLRRKLNGAVILVKEASWECLLVDPKEHPMLLAEPSSNTQQQREKAAEIMFEKYQVPALFLAKNAVLTSFASGRATSLVVDSGGGSTTIAPVHDGYVLQKAVATSPIGGEFLTDCLIKSLESKGRTIKPRYSFKRKEIRPGEFQTVDLDFPDTTESYKLYSQRVIASDIKECVCRAPDTPYDESSYSNIPMTPYELPDGQTIEIGADRFKTPDVLFNPSLVQTIPGMESYAETASSARGLPQMVIESINKCDVDIRRELFSSILVRVLLLDLRLCSLLLRRTVLAKLAGGTASMQQLKERLEKDLLEESPQAARVKVLASGNATERRFSVWIGGSILASLGSFQQMWFSKSEYEEHGAAYIQRKCP